MEAIILAGGFGTRLQSVVKDVPKPMAPIGERPFLDYLLYDLIKKGITKFILSTGYKHDIIESHYMDRFMNIPIWYSKEEEPLGTGGAIKKALALAKEEHVFVVNGDTFFDLDLKNFLQLHITIGSGLSLALKPMINFDRYGTVEISSTKVIGFKNKQYHETGNINGGIYILDRKNFNKLNHSDKFSFEEDFLKKQGSNLNAHAFVFDKYFIDIGIPDDYVRAQSELKHFCEK